MKRLAWLLLAISLPAWATINGVDSSRVVLPSFDGTRYGAYVAGDLPFELPNDPELLYINTFDGNPTNTTDHTVRVNSKAYALGDYVVPATPNGYYYRATTAGTSASSAPSFNTTVDSTTSDGSVVWTNKGTQAYGNIGIFSDQSDIDLYPVSIRPNGDKETINGITTVYRDGPDISIVDDPDNPGNLVAKFYMDASTNGANFEPSFNGKHRAVVRFGIADSMSNDLSGAHTTGGNGIRAVPDHEYWVGYRYRNTIVGNLANARYIFSELASTTTGDPILYIKKNGTSMDVSPERYKPLNSGSTIETGNRVKTITGLAQSEWHCVVSRIIRKPYSWGTAESYIPGTTPGARSGVYQVYVDGVLGEGDAASEANPAWTGTDREARGEYNPSLVRLGIYWAEQNTDAASVTLYLDDIRIAEGSELFDAVNPPECPAMVSP